MSDLPRALPRSGAKSSLLKHLNMSEEKEADVVYKELVGDRRNLKPSQWNAAPPYDWNHISERSREEAVNKLASGGGKTTAYYWHRGSAPLQDGLPWLPVWFLYKMFRHRDGRARSSKSHAASAQKAPKGKYVDEFVSTGTRMPVSRGTSSAMQNPAYVIADSVTITAKHEFNTRAFYDPVREEYIER